MIKMIQNNPDIQRKSERHKVFSTKPFEDIKADLEALNAQGKFKITFSGNLSELAKRPLDELDASQRDAVLWFNNRNKNDKKAT